MNKKIAFIGAGKVSTALGLYFKNKGFEILGYYSQTPESAGKAAQRTNSTAYASAEELMKDGRMIWITTPDDQIESVVRQLSSFSTLPKKAEKLVLHASGAHSREILKPLKEIGYQTACAHPLFAFDDPVLAQKKLNDVWFAIEKPEKENRELTDFFRKCGNRVLYINSDKKTLYHAAACVLSNYLVTLVDASYKIFEKSGIKKDDIQKATLPLLQSVIDNLQNKNPKDALTGPIKRGDKNTVSMHIESLNTFMPEMMELYTLMGKETEKMLVPARSADHLKKKLEENKK